MSDIIRNSLAAGSMGGIGSEPGGRNCVTKQEENEKIKRQIVWAHVLRTVYFIVAYEDDTYNIRPFRLLTDRFHIQALQCLCSLAP